MGGMYSLSVTDAARRGYKLEPAREERSMTPSALRPLALICLIALPVGARAEAPTGPARPSAKVAAKAPPPRCVIAPVDLAITPRVSLNALRSPCARNYLGLALGVSKAGELRGLQIALGANGVERDAMGLQVALGVNGVGSDAKGVQLAGLVNAAGESFTGFQIAGLINAGGEDVTGLQLAGLGNASGEGATGIQLSGLFNASGEGATGIQVAGLFNAAGEGLRGAQVSLLFNAAGGGGAAIQVAGLFNAIGGPATGAQLAGLFNAAERLRGLQIAGGMNAVENGEGMQAALGYNRALGQLDGVQIAALNVGRDVHGAQIGLVNIARDVHGMQLGLVNVADHADAPIGAVSWVRSGERALEVWGGEALALSAGFRLGTERIYSLVGLASGPLVDGNPWGPVGGAGVKGRFGRIGVLVDALVHGLFFDGIDEQALLVQARARLAYDLTPRLALVAGPTWNLFVSGDRDGTDLPLGADTVDRSGDRVVRQWPGLTAGAALRW